MSKQLVSGKHRLRNTYWSLVGAASATILSVQPVMAETIWDRFSTIMRDIYGQLVGISTIVAVTVAAIALLVRMVSRNQRAVDEATSWLKRVVVTWIILNTLGFSKLLQPQDDEMKYIFVLPNIAMASQMMLPKAPCLFATVNFAGQEEPDITFYTEEAATDGLDKLVHSSAG